MNFFNVIFAALNGALAPRTRGSTGHATLHVLMLLFAVMSTSFTVVEADNVLVGRCLPAGCNKKGPTSDIWYDPTLSKVGYFGGGYCKGFKSLWHSDLKIASEDCQKDAILVDPMGCATSGTNFQYLCPIV